MINSIMQLTFGKTMTKDFYLQSVTRAEYLKAAQGDLQGLVNKFTAPLQLKQLNMVGVHFCFNL